MLISSTNVIINMPVLIISIKCVTLRA